jgi:hypothetical protein
MPVFAPVDRPELVLLFVGEGDEDEDEVGDWTAFEVEEVLVGVAVAAEVDDNEEVLVTGAVEIGAPDEPRVKRSVFCEMGNRPIPESQHPFV